MSSIKCVYEIACSLKDISKVVDNLTKDLAVNGFTDRSRIDEIKIALQEIIINAIEHGNLEISFKDKSKFLENGINIEDIIKKYSKKEKYSDRKVTITYCNNKNKVIYKIKDEGKGFNWKNTVKKIIKKDNLMLEHGRGLLLANKYFDKLKFNEKGNEVIAEVYKN